MVLNCVSVQNLPNKETLECQIPVDDSETSFLERTVKSQPKEQVFVYKFSNDKSYFVINDIEPVIEPASELSVTILDKLINHERSDPITSIHNSLKKILESAKIENQLTKEDVIKVTNKLIADPKTSEIIEARDKYFKQQTQQGGFLIWLTQKLIIDRLPDPLRIFFNSILEMIDIILIVLSSIPGLQFVAGIGIVFDILSLCYTFLRLDIVGMIGSIISFIPFVGDIIGGLIRTGNKVYVYSKLYNKYINRPVRKQISRQRVYVQK